MHVSWSCSDTFYSKIIKKNLKSPIFESLPFLYYLTFSEYKGVSRTSSDRIICFNKNKACTKLLISQIMG